jgi:predicted MPP superfamily phosphohydrolase
VKALARGAALVAALALLLLAAGLYNATRPPLVVVVRHELPGHAPGTRLRVLLLADIHYGFPDMPASRLASIVEAANALKPDVIVIGGDYMGGKLLDWPRPWLEDALPPLAGLKASLGVWGILGNHDQPSWTPRVLRHQPSPRLLVNAHVDLGPVVLAGLESLDERPDFAKAMAGAPPGKPLILAVHEPRTLLTLAPPGRADVVALAGHTHGGQIRLPLIGRPAVLLLRHEPCWRGGCIVNGWPVHVTSGVGTSWLPIRFGVPPEMVLLTFEAPAQASGRKSATER